MLSFDYDRKSNVFVDVNGGAKNHNFNIPLNLDKYNIMMVMLKLKLMQEFTSAINVEYLHSSLQAKLLMHNCARAKDSKTCFCGKYRMFEGSVVWKISAYDTHIQEQQI